MLTKKIVITCDNKYSVMYFASQPAIINLINKIPDEMRKMLVIIDPHDFTSKLPTVCNISRVKSLEKLEKFGDYLLLDPCYYFITTEEIKRKYNDLECELKENLHVNSPEKFQQALAIKQYGKNKASNFFVRHSLRRNSDYERYILELKKIKLTGKEKVLIGDSRSVDFIDEAVDNISIGGCTINAYAQGMMNLDKLKTVVIFLGINDLIYEYNLNTISFKTEQLFRNIKNKNSNVFVCGNYKLLHRNEDVNKSVDDLNNIISKLCKEFDFDYIPLDFLCDEDLILREKYSKDGLHLNQLGQNKLFQCYKHLFKL